jgi:hypothetical protein
MVAAKGFATGERTGIEVRVGVERVVDVELAVGAAEQTVTAEADAATLDAATSETGGVETGKAVRELPLNGRDWTTLAALEPGVSIVRTQNPVVLDVPRGNRGYGVMMSIGGSRPQQSSYWLDGINVNDYAGGAPASVLGASLGVDSVEEFSVITANPPVNYGKTSVGAVNAVTRAGTNQIHGSTYEFLRNSALDARNFFDPSTLPPFKRNQFGGSLGGPVKRRRTFFFVNYEGVRQGLGVTNVDTVPSPSARAGNLSTGNVTVSPRVAPFLAFFPLPNGPVRGDAGTYTFSTQNDTHENFVTARMDHHFSEKDAIHATYQFGQAATTGPDVYGGVLLGISTRRQVTSAEESHILSPSAVNFLRIGLNRTVAEEVQSLSAINPLAADPSFGFLPGRDVGQIQIAGITEYPGGLYATGDYHFHYTSYQLYDDLSITRGSHSLRAGISVEAIRSNALGAGTNNGVANFGSLASFLTDQPSSFTATIPGTNAPVGLRQVIAGGYIKDEWRAHRNLTVNLGLRYEMATVPTEEHNQLATLTFGSQHLREGGSFFENPTHRDFQRGRIIF